MQAAKWTTEGMRKGAVLLAEYFMTYAYVSCKGYVGILKGHVAIT